jgi:deoxyribodipyrimidine photo-lyase
MPHLINPRRVHILRPGAEGGGPMLYWMSREQRAQDNWPLLEAQRLAFERQRPLCVVFCLAPEFLGASSRIFDFMLRGLAEVASDCRALNLGFVLLRGAPGATVARFAREIDACALVTEFDPLRLKRRWRDELLSAVEIPVFEIDGHNIVPCRSASSKQEVGARTLRPRIQRLLPEFLTPYPALLQHPWTFPTPEPDFPSVAGAASFDWLAPGPSAAAVRLDAFIARRLPRYAAQRNDPNADAESNLSPYLHFGSIAPQRVALAVLGATRGADINRASFLDELIIRRELSDNFCHYAPNYDSLDAAPAWARRSLDARRRDRRNYLYGAPVFEQANTHDPLWNAAQNQLQRTGKMHGYMRMYWAKKILEWSASPEEALAITLRLNDGLSLDGRDPNGYAGALWSIAGLHDRPWRERPVYGAVRYMNANGCRRKFDVDAYVRRWEGEGKLS